MTNFVQLYKSTDTNAPVLTGQVNKVTALLNACLVNGYSTASVTSITRSGATATVTLGGSNATLVSGNYVTISGATGGDASLYNGTFPITVTDSTHFTYTMGGTPSGSATGTLLYAKAGLGWTNPFGAGTNSQTYRSADSSSNKFYLQVIDNGATAGGAKECQVYAAEVMSADQTVTSGQFPTAVQLANGLCWRKSSTADTVARNWTLIGDDRTFYLIMQDTNTTGTATIGGFGHFITDKSGDGYNTFIGGYTSFNTAPASLNQQSLIYGGAFGALWAAAVLGIYIARSYSQTGSSLNAGICGYGIAGAFGQSNLIPYPNGPDSGAYLAPVILGEPNTIKRGRLPGLYNPLHANAFSNYDTITGVVGLSGVTLTIVAVQNNNTNGQVAFDTFGPWN